MAPKSKTPKHYNIPGHAHGLTFCCYHHRWYMRDRVACEMLIDELAKAKEEFNLSVWAYVAMVNHAHALVSPKNDEYSVSQILQKIKGRSSKRYGDYVRKNKPREYGRFLVVSRRRSVFRLWQHGGGFDRNVWKGIVARNVIRYIENNPVKARLVRKPEQYRFSSAYARKHQKGLVPDDCPLALMVW